jgi:protein-S-isoprenylcysteine O-methyltransferase Ste14
MKLGKWLFAIRSYTPIPLIILTIIFAHPSRSSFCLGFLIAAIGEAIRIWAVGYAGSITRATEVGAGASLVTAGPYAQVRNPIYLGNFLISLGLCIAAFVLWIIPIFLLGYVIQYFSIVRAEEEHLKKRFGALYESYLEHVPRFIPSLKNYDKVSEHKFSIRQALKSEKRTFAAIVLTFGVVAVRLWK